MAYEVDTLTNRYNSIGGNNLNYDDAGNTTVDPSGYQYTYDYENRLIKITRGEDDIAEYTYDALGRRIQVYDMVAETNPKDHQMLLDIDACVSAERDVCRGCSRW